MTLTPLKRPSSIGLRVTGTLIPALAVLIASPFTVIATASVFETGNTNDAVVALPTLLALLSAPGYLYALVGWIPIRGLGRPRRWWIRASFLVALVASLLGTLMSLSLVLPAVLAFATAWIIVAIWTRLEWAPVTRDSPTHGA